MRLRFNFYHDEYRIRRIEDASGLGFLIKIGDWFFEPAEILMSQEELSEIVDKLGELNDGI